MTKKIFNFDHGIKKPTIFSIGPFTIEVKNHHCDNLKSLHRRESREFTYNEKLERIINYKKEIPGELAETAVVSWDNQKIDHSVLFTEQYESNKIFDLLIIRYLGSDEKLPIFRLRPSS